MRSGRPGIQRARSRTPRRGLVHHVPVIGEVRRDGPPGHLVVLDEEQAGAAHGELLGGRREADADAEPAHRGSSRPRSCRPWPPRTPGRSRAPCPIPRRAAAPVRGGPGRTGRTGAPGHPAEPPGPRRRPRRAATRASAAPARMRTACRPAYGRRRCRSRCPGPRRTGRRPPARARGRPGHPRSIARAAAPAGCCGAPSPPARQARRVGGPAGARLPGSGPCPASPFTRLPRRAASASIASAVARTAVGSGSAAASARPPASARMLATGVRRSCDTESRMAARSASLWRATSTAVARPGARRAGARCPAGPPRARAVAVRRGRAADRPPGRVAWIHPASPPSARIATT